MSVNTHYEMKVGEWTVVGRLHADGSHKGSVQFTYRKGESKARLPGSTKVPKEVEKEVLAAREEVKTTLKLRLSDGPELVMKSPKTIDISEGPEVVMNAPKAMAKAAVKRARPPVVRVKVPVKRVARPKAQGSTSISGSVDGNYEMKVGSWTVVGRLHTGGIHKGAVQFCYKKEGSDYKLPGSTRIPKDLQEEVLAAKTKVKRTLKARLGLPAGVVRTMKAVRSTTAGRSMKEMKAFKAMKAARVTRRPMKAMKRR